jgi:Secretion system C-terminal sorting domain
MSPNLKIFSLNACLLFVLILSFEVSAQNSAVNGNWTTGSTWSGGSVPSGWTTINVNHTVTKTSGHNVEGVLNINSPNGKLTINGNLVVTGGSVVNVYGELNITGNLTLNSNFNVHPGGKVIVDGSVTIVSAPYLTIGTAVAPPGYADMVIKQNLISQTSGDVTINQNGRFAVYGNVTNDTGGDTVITVNQGGQVYVHGSINLVGGGDDIINNNATEPFGLYVNGSVSSSGGGSTIDSNVGDQQDLFDTNPDFANWVATQSGSPLPVELIFFDALKHNGSVELNWATASQLNFDYFSVEHSAEGLQWNEIKRIKGKGTTENKDEYNLKTVKSLVGNNYYRLKMIDLDGTFEYSKVLKVTIEEPMLVSIYPNPIRQSDVVSVELNFTPNEGDRIAVYNVYGTELLSLPIYVTKIQLPISDFKEGAYVIKYKGSNFSQSYKMLVQ